jgi:hypothetical protein
MMAMTIFMGAIPPQGPALRVQVQGGCRFFTRVESRSRSNIEPEESNRVPSPEAGLEWQEMKSFLDGPRALARVSVSSSRKNQITYAYFFIWVPKF